MTPVCGVYLDAGQGVLCPKVLAPQHRPSCRHMASKRTKERSQRTFNQMNWARSPKKRVIWARERSTWVKRMEARQCCMCRLKYVQTFCVGSWLCLWPAPSCDTIIASRRARPMSGDMKAKGTSRCAFNLQRHMSYHVYKCQSLVDVGVLLCSIHSKTVSTYLACPRPGTFHLS